MPPRRVAHYTPPGVWAIAEVAPRLMPWSSVALSNRIGISYRGYEVHGLVGPDIQLCTFVWSIESARKYRNIFFFSLMIWRLRVPEIFLVRRVQLCVISSTCVWYECTTELQLIKVYSFDIRKWITFARNLLDLVEIINTSYKWVIRAIHLKCCQGM